MNRLETTEFGKVAFAQNDDACFDESVDQSGVPLGVERSNGAGASRGHHTQRQVCHDSVLEKSNVVS